MPSDSLLIPPQLRSFLLSPPPSPPEGWEPKDEEINKIPYTDLTPTEMPDGSFQLLPKTPSSPSIIFYPPEYCKK